MNNKFTNIPTNTMLASKLDSSKIPNKPGVYFLYMKEDAWESLNVSAWANEDMSSCYRTNIDGVQYLLVYVGIAGKGNPLRKRICNQHFGSIANINASTVRQTLGAISSPQIYCPEALSKFEKDNMAISWQVASSKQQALAIESNYLSTCPFPLNSKGNKFMTGHKKVLSSLRKQLREQRKEDRKNKKLSSLP